MPDTNPGLMTVALKSKLDGIEAAADVTDATNVSAAGALLKVAGGAAIGVIAGVILPFSVLTGAVIGGAYAAWRQTKK